MSGTNIFKQYAGSICLYNTIEQRKPSVFLKRNIRRVLDGHERELQCATAKSKLKAQTLTIPNRSMHDQHAITWSLPPQQMLKDVMEAQTPILKIEPRELKKAGPRFGCQDQRNRRVSPEWLPDLDAIRLKCIITMKICDKGWKGRVFIQNSEHANLVGFSSEGEDLRFAIHMVKPFIVDLNKLLVKADNSGEFDHLRQWKKTSYAGHVVSFTISFLNSHDAAQLLSIIDPQFTLGTSPEGCELRANWKKLPLCPPPSRLHRLFRTDKGSSKHLDYGLDFDMAWTEPKDTPLAVTNRAYREADTHSQLKGSSEMAPFQRDINIHRMTYIYDGGALQARKIVSNDLKCMFCNSSHRSFKRLHFHYLASHDHFTYDVVKQPGAGEVIDVKIYLHLADRQYERASNNVSDEREIHWTRPERAFDLDAYLDGSDIWISDKPVARKARAKSPKRLAAPKAQMAAPTRPVKAPEQVKELPRKMKKKHSVPKVAGVTFFRTSSKRRVEPGEELSESDDDVNVTWLKMTQAGRPLPNLLGAARELAALYDEHMHTEDLAGDHFVGDAVLRFTQAQKEKLSSQGIFHEYLKKLSQLRESGLVAEAMSKYCTGLLEAYRSTLQNGNSSDLNEEGPSLSNGETCLRNRKPDLNESRTGLINGLTDSYTASKEPTEEHTARRKRMVEDAEPGASSIEPPRKRVKQALEEVLAETSDIVKSPNKRRKQLMKALVKADSDTAPTNSVSHSDRVTTNGTTPKRNAVPESAKTAVQPQASIQQPSLPSPPPRRNGTCICNQVATGRGITICSNVKCPHNEFHMKCVGLTSHNSTWRCPDCRSTGTS